MRVLGADPGLDGGLAVVECGRLDAAAGMPVLETKRGRMVDAVRLHGWLAAMPVVDAVVIERAQSMPRQGVASTFRYGQAVGALEALLRVSFPEARMEWVAASVWKRAMGLTADKGRSLAEATLRFGEAMRLQHWSGRGKHGTAEAALLAAWMEARLP